LCGSWLGTKRDSAHSPGAAQADGGFRARDPVNPRAHYNLHGAPCWLPFLESIGKSPMQLDAIPFKVTLRN
jgi:hypothetical protein